MYTKEEFKKLPVFITTMSRWDGDLSSASLALAKVLSQENEVFYIDYPYTWADLWRERKKETLKKRIPALLFGKNYLNRVHSFGSRFFALSPKAVLPIYSMPEGFWYEKANAYNSSKIAEIVNKVCKEKNLTDFLFLNSFNPVYLSEIQSFLNPLVSVYHSRDAIEEVPGHGLRKENVCVKNYDLSMATSVQLCQRIQKRNGKFIHYFPNGGDVNLFRKAVTENYSRPEEIADITTPIIGYTGAVCQRMDYALMVKILEANPDKTVVVVGPRRDHLYTKIPLDKYKNLRFVSPRPIEELPPFLRHFDCTIIPFKKNNLTEGIYPLKINEYLAAGRPVVTTDFSEDIRGFSKYVFMASTHTDFLQSIDKALKSHSDALYESRFAVAHSNSWEKRKELFWDLSYATYLKKIGVEQEDRVFVS